MVVVYSIMIWSTAILKFVYILELVYTSRPLTQLWRNCTVHILYMATCICFTQIYIGHQALFSHAYHILAYVTNHQEKIVMKNY